MRQAAMEGCGVKISARGRCAVRGMLDVALNSRNFPTPLADISLRQGITISNLEQLFAKLRRAGLVRSVRGPGGGYFLAQVPQQITIADILRAVEEPLLDSAAAGGQCDLLGAFPERERFAGAFGGEVV